MRAGGLESNALADIVDKGSGRPGHQDLTTVSGGCDASSAMDLEAGVVAPTKDCLTSVDTHPDSNGRPIRPVVRRQGALSGDCRQDCLTNRRKDGEDRITFARHERPAGFLDSAAQQSKVVV